ncbi:MAG TPA: ATPase [Thermoplasmatales archaeon]|nr:MAG: ATPase [Candidatus Bathyarchaeota archaeon ex4484_205]HDO19769.1 ATPase [Thermoplasmatales archaeon]
MIRVKKASGRLEPFNREKLINTLVRVGADEETANEIVSVIERRIWDGIPTSEILDRALTLLHKRYPPASIRYDLKRAVMLLGPSGYPFEDYFASILRAHGYIVEGVRMIIEGRCVTHEVDVVVRYKSERVFVECKYHNRRGIKTDLKPALYTYARLLDLNDQFDNAWLVTNTSLTTEAEKYLNCRNLLYTSWNHPEGLSLRELIDSCRLYPVTSLNLPHSVIEEMLAEGVVTIKDLINRGSKYLSLLMPNIDAKSLLNDLKRIS